MYKKPFYINTPVWNNSFSYSERKNKRLYVPSLIKANIDSIELQKDNLEKIAFEDFNISNKLQSCFWLKNFYEIKWDSKKIYLFDNHNHAFYFWYLEKLNKNIWDNNILFHIDEHSDMREPKNIIKKELLTDIKKVFDYTNFELNVWNYIVPAIKNWLIKEVIQIRSESEIIESTKKLEAIKDDLIILNLDLDFFRAELDYIDYKLKKKIVLDIAKEAQVITVSSSPFFIEQNLAIKVFKDLFWNKKS